MRDAQESPPLAEQFRRFATGAARDGAHRYERICMGVAEDEALLAIVAGAPAGQRRPNILLAAVHFLLLSGADDPLVSFYPSVLSWRGEPGGGRSAVDDPYPQFAAFCARHRDAVAALVSGRATQTNEVGRCTAILPALCAVAVRAERPLAIVDLGASAGLNLLFDRFAYDYGTGVLAGTARSAVVLGCEVRAGDDTLRTALPPVAARVGIDRHPVDVHDDDAALWLLACQWPDHLDRFEHSRAALSLARSLDDPPQVVTGDAVDDLVRVAGTLPGDAHLCLVHSWVAAYLSPDQQRALGRAVAEVAATRPVSWLFAEAPYEVPGLPVPPPPEGAVKGATAVVLVDHDPPGRGGPRRGGAEPTARRIADMHSHGRWLHWYGTDTPPRGAMPSRSSTR